MGPWPLILILLIILMLVIPAEVWVVIGLFVWAIAGVWLMFEGSLRHQKNPKDKMGLVGFGVTLAWCVAWTIYAVLQ